MLALFLSKPCFQGEAIPVPGAQHSSPAASPLFMQAQATPLTRVPGGAQSALLAPGLSVLATAFRVGGAAPMQGLAAHIAGDFLPADVHVDVVVRQVLWWHRHRGT